MGKQRHDIGYRKRLAREQPRIHNNRPINPETLAASLIKRGLAAPSIRGGNTTRQPTRTRNVAPDLMEERRRGDCTFNGVTPIQEVTNEHAGRVGTAAGRDGGR
ncbi:hypothetical protein [Micrococcus terreus]|uniref:hypothetical protein n=1 Tax=Micrococcus terreus TaxID=574650 RepID=UPI002953DCE6|nr:hypothetical protein [Micrococcus terreus]WOO97814.1 hypothetical protein R3I42_01125 [Micrococcus terreus]